MSAPLICPVCGYGNRPGASVCEDCGLLIPQYQACPTCGFLNTGDSRFCGNCGSPVGAERKLSGGPSRLRGPAPPPTAAPEPPDPDPRPAAPAPIAGSEASILPRSPLWPAAPAPIAESEASILPRSPLWPAPSADPIETASVRSVLEDVAGAIPRKAGPTFRLVHEGSGVEIRLPLADATLIVGRPGGDPDVDISGFPEATVVSRKHAKLLVAAGQLSIEDLASANGTYVNNVRVRSATALSDGDRIAFGQGAKVVFTLHFQ